LLGAAKSFGGTLEWYVARELRRRFGFDVAAGVRFHARGVGGDLDVVAAAEGKLVYIELKSSPPKNLEPREVGAFLDRVYMLRPDVTLFVVDTALRLGDKVLPMLVTELEHRRAGTQLITPRRIERELWALMPHLYAVNAKPDLMSNIARAIAGGLRALSPLLW
jgi:Holliday junction resolvase